MFHELGNIIASVAVGQSGLKQMSIFSFKILLLLLIAKDDWKIIVPKILWRPDWKGIASYWNLTQSVLQDIELYKNSIFLLDRFFCL